MCRVWSPELEAEVCQSLHPKLTPGRAAECVLLVFTHDLAQGFLIAHEVFIRVRTTEGPFLKGNQTGVLQNVDDFLELVSGNGSTKRNKITRSS